MYRLCMALGLGACLLSPVGAADGLAALFDTQSHDFGNVPYGPTLHHAFTIKNTTQQTLQIASLRVSCGCVTPSASAYSIPPGKTATVNAQMDTRRYRQPVTIYVLFNKPWLEEARLVVSVTLRSDIAMNPDRLEFGKVRRGGGPAASTVISFVGQTRVAEATSESGYVQLSIKEPKNTGYGLSYELTARLRSDIPVGNWYTDVWVKTNNNARIRIPVTVEVEPSLTVTPGTIAFDSTKIGEPVKKSIVVKGAQPFKIVDVKGGDGVFTAVATSTESKSTHLITVTFKPGKEGDFAKSLEIVTDMKDEGKVEVPVKGKGMQ